MSFLSPYYPLSLAIIKVTQIDVMSNPSCRGFHELWQLHSARVCLLTSSMAHNCTSSRYCVGLPHLCIQCIIGPTSDVGIRPIWTVLSSHCHFVICIVYFAIRLGIKCCTSSTFSAEYVSLCILTANLNRTLAKVKKNKVIHYSQASPCQKVHLQCVLLISSHSID